MITENTSKVSDAKLQSYGLKFTFITESEKLIIEASDSNHDQSYVGEIAANPYTDFDDIKELLTDGQFKLLSKST